MQPIFFTKLSTLDNNYLILNYLEQPELSLDYATLAQHITNPCTGISSDGIIILLPSELADFKMVIYNQDGSRAKTCGNGLRLIGRYLIEMERFNQPEISIETDANVSNLTHDNDLITVDLGLAHSLIDPFHPLSLESQVKDYCGEIGTPYGTWAADMISMGNPHFIIYTDDDHDAFRDEMESISKQYDVNVGMLTVITKNELLLTTYERGSGLTGACGTNAAAAVASAVARRQVNPYETITVHLPGGDLNLKWNDEAHLMATGRCTKVCCGTYFFEEDLSY